MVSVQEAVENRLGDQVLEIQYSRSRSFISPARNFWLVERDTFRCESVEHLRLSKTTPEVCRFGVVSRLPNTLPVIAVAVRFAQSLLPPPR
jgi:hypothetical protein